MAFNLPCPRLWIRVEGPWAAALCVVQGALSAPAQPPPSLLGCQCETVWRKASAAMHP